MFRGEVRKHLMPTRRDQLRTPGVGFLLWLLLFDGLDKDIGVMARLKKIKNPSLALRIKKERSEGREPKNLSKSLLGDPLPSQPRNERPKAASAPTAFLYASSPSQPDRITWSPPDAADHRPLLCVLVRTYYAHEKSLYTFLHSFISQVALDSLLFSFNIKGSIAHQKKYSLKLPDKNGNIPIAIRLWLFNTDLEHPDASFMDPAVSTSLFCFLYKHIEC